MASTRTQTFGILAATALAFTLVATPSSAAPLAWCSSGPGIDLVNDGCRAPGNDHQPAVEGAILDATGLVVKVFLYGKSDDHASLFEFSPEDPEGSFSGTWKVKDGTLIHYFTLKGATEFALYHLNPPTSEGFYSSLGLLTPNGKNTPGTSHISFWTVEGGDRGGTIPEPAVLTLFGLALAFAGHRLRRRA